jgi:D-alanine-D-alanine ligase
MGEDAADYNALTSAISDAVTQAKEAARDLRLLFVTNLREEGDLQDLGPQGVLNSAQWYTAREAEAMVRSFQDLGLTVEPFFSEMDFLREVAIPRDANDHRQRIVYSTAEGGSGAGRRALLPSLCNLLDLPILNSGAHASSMVRHKFHAYTVLRESGIRVPETWQFGRDGWTRGSGPSKGSRVIVKPVYESMGIGVDDDSVVTVDSGFDAFVAGRARKFQQPAVVQDFISGEEVGVPVARIGETYALPPIAQRRANGSRYGERPKTFRDEHVEHDLSHVVHVSSRAEIEAIRAAAASAFDALDMKGVGRIDFRVDVDGRAWVFDTNGEPPPLAKTCWAVAMETLGFSLLEMLALWVGICLLDHGLVHESTQNESSQQGINRP